MKKISLLLIIAIIVATSFALWYRAEKTIHSTPAINTVTVGINTEFPPFSFKEDEQMAGFDIDVITEVFKRLKKEIVFKDMPFEALIPEIQLGNIHVIASGITPTKERAQRTLFTQPHLTGNPLLMISRKDTPALTTVDELVGKTVAVNEGYVADYYISEQPGITVLRLSSALVGDGMLALESGRADVFVAATHSMKPYFKKYDSNNFNIMPIAGTEETSAFAISKHYPELRDYIQIALDRMQADGTLAQLKTKWDLL